jgi:hypothetical protein
MTLLEDFGNGYWFASAYTNQDYGQGAYWSLKETSYSGVIKYGANYQGANYNTINKVQPAMQINLNLLDYTIEG